MTTTQRRAFVSFYGGDEQAVRWFIETWADRAQVFSPIVLHDAYNGELIDSNDTEYVIGRIRRDFVADATVTLLLLGPCTHSRRYVDWELKASLRQSKDSLPNGLLGVTLPGAPSSLWLPDRFLRNWDKNNDGSRYSKWYAAPETATQLWGWIEGAFAARRTRSHLIDNPVDRMRYNARCNVHSVTH
jgi:hypothetical protein